MDFHDKVLQCSDCGSDFVWTAGEQAFYADKHFTNEPKRCKACKAKRGPRQAQGHGGGGGQSRERVEIRATCSACGKGRPVYCRECFQQRKTHG